MKKIMFSKDGVAIADHMAMTAVLSEENVFTSSAIVIFALQVAIKNGETDVRSVTFHSEKDVEEVIFNEDGRSDFWPEGFCDTYDKFLEVIVGF